MKFAHLASRVAVGGVSAALATAGLVAVTSTSAQAVTATTDYSCTIPTQPNSTFKVAVTLPIVPPTAPAGYPVPAGLLSFTSTVTVPGAVGQGLAGFGINGGKSDDFSTSFGDKVALAPVVWNTLTPGAPDPAVDPWVFSGKGGNGAFTLPKAGTYAITMPKQFTLIPTSNGAALPFTSTCTSAAPATIASITLSKQAATVKAKAPKSAKHGAVVTVKGKVSNEYSKTGGEAVTGKVIVKDGKKKVGTAKIKKGKFVVKVKGLAVGSHKLTVSYKGDGFTAKGVSKELKLNVTK